MSSKEIAQKVSDFEFSRINAPDDIQRHSIKDQDTLSDRYSIWGLSQIIRSFNLMEDFCEIYWVGYGDKYYIQAFIFCLLSGFKNSKNEINSNYFAKTKYSLYQICEKYLSMAEQKRFVENLCSWQYTNNVANYLGKNNAIVQLIQKIYRKYIQSLYQFLQPIQEIKLFSLNFPFLSLEIVSQTSAIITNFQHKFIVVAEKGCVFVVEQNSEKIAIKDSYKSVQQDPQSQRSINKQKYERSTPKFVPKADHYMVSSIQNRLKSTSEVRIEGFDQRQKDVSRRYQGNYFKKKTPKKQDQNRLFDKKFQNLSLRNTIDMHIATLQKYNERKKKNRQSHQLRSFFFKNDSKSKSKSKSKQKQKQKQKSKFEQRLMAQFAKSKNSDINNRSPSSEGMSKILANYQALQAGSNGNMFSSQLSSSVSSPKNWSMLNQPKVSFTYFSP